MPSTLGLRYVSKQPCAQPTSSSDARRQPPTASASRFTAGSRIARIAAGIEVERLAVDLNGLGPRGASVRGHLLPGIRELREA